MRLLSVFIAVLATARLFAAEAPLVIDFTQSRVDIAVKATADSFVGHLVSFDPKVRVSDEGSVTAASLAFHFRDIRTGKDARDRAMHTWQHTDEHPDGTFVLTSVQPAAGATATAFGRLTLHGMTRDVRFPVSVNRDGPQYAIDGDAVIDTREFGLPKIRMLGLLTVDPLVHVRFHLQGTRGALSARQP